MHVRETLQSIFRQRPRDAWLALLADKNVCIGPVNTLAEVFDDPHVRHRHMLLEHKLPTGRHIRQAGIGLKLSDTPGEVRQCAPYLGQHTQEVLTTLGYSQLEIARFRTSNIVS
jgi:crotonobetainyl-CoA:carnitine CoA-transferase CaiB-like acyl-CoA transferase